MSTARAPESTTASSAGFSIKVTDPRVERLYRRSLSGPCGADAKTATRTSRCRNGRNMQRKRQPLVIWDDVERAFYAALGRAGVSADEAKSWPAIELGTRISHLEQGTSTSPERQIENMASWCVQHQRRPIGLRAEETSGSIFRKVRRRRFEEFYDDIANDRVRDPETGELIDGIAYFRYDRFTREPDECGKWLRLLLEKRINLYETQYGDPPRDLFQIEHEIRVRVIEAAREVDTSRGRVLNAIEGKIARNEPLFGCELWGRTRIVDPVTGKTIRYEAIPKYRETALRVVQEIIDGKSVHATIRELNAEGFTTLGGGELTPPLFGRLLGAAHLAGLARVRLDPRRVHDPTYEGELVPRELVYPAGGAPPAGWVPPVEPLIPYPMWEELQRVLSARRRPHGPQTRHLASGLFSCAVCGAPLVSGQGHYRCTKQSFRYRKPDAPQSGTRISADGQRHGTVSAMMLEELIAEIVFAAIDVSSDASQPEPSVETEQRDYLLKRIRDLEERLGNTSYMLSRGHLRRDQYDELANEIFAERREVEAELRELTTAKAKPRLREGKSLRELWPELDGELKRQWAALVIESGQIAPFTNGHWPAITERVTITFCEGYEPPADEVAALIAKLEAHYRLRQTGARRPSDGLARRLIELHESDLQRDQIIETLQAEGLEAPSRRGDWTPYVLQRATKDAYALLGGEYVVRTRVSGPRGLSAETLGLMRDIYQASGSWQTAADELNRLGMRTATGQTWTRLRLRQTLTYHSHRLGLEAGTNGRRSRAGRPRYLDAATREKVWRMHKVDGMTFRAIADWLTERGIQTAKGRKEWGASTVYCIVRSVDEEKARLQPAA